MVGNSQMQALDLAPDMDNFVLNQHQQEAQMLGEAQFRDTCLAAVRVSELVHLMQQCVRCCMPSVAFLALVGSSCWNGVAGKKRKWTVFILRSSV